MKLERKVVFFAEKKYQYTLCKNVTVYIYITSNSINPLSASVALIETSQLICSANQLTGFYMKATLALNGLSPGEPVATILTSSDLNMNM